MKSRTLDLALALALLAGCDGGVHRAEPIECDPVADEGCPDGAHCRLLRGGALACLPPEVRVAAGPCGPGSPDTSQPVAPTRANTHTANVAIL